MHAMRSLVNSLWGLPFEDNSTRATSCRVSYSFALTPSASAAALGHVRLQAVARDSRFARF